MQPTDVTSTVSPMPELIAPAHWHTVEFISDLHLDPGEPATVQAWRDYLANSKADAIFLLGDIFEVWVGDDALLEPSSFEAQCAQTLLAASAQRSLFFMVGNRDFLAGDAFLQASGMTGLSDPTLLAWGEYRIVLSHGDALCLDDVEYQKFRTLSRSAAWQQQLLSQPLAVRRAIGKSARTESEQRKQSGAPYADADPTMTAAWMQQTHAKWLVHGHTHRPAEHALPNGGTRIVLSDWHIDSRTHRAEVLRLSSQGWQRQPL
ncbi:UDP-2,3-diacylglucosamine diphosphatase [Comamonas sp. NoAH]|uniref:UDP-2,3-diacylglucosamine diphosphatase n=1 Tax=Comamonas halotolerans TaxID=3041496 RepID=UPI0024E186C5|nr:UDP-2,3-diacylglucosamine diphosphatase [Comamonas sp. NoAH]